MIYHVPIFRPKQFHSEKIIVQVCVHNSLWVSQGKHRKTPKVFIKATRTRNNFMHHFCWHNKAYSSNKLFAKVLLNFKFEEHDNILLIKHCASQLHRDFERANNSGLGLNAYMHADIKELCAPSTWWMPLLFTTLCMINYKNTSNLSGTNYSLY